jgi:hypothetical protein
MMISCAKLSNTAWSVEFRALSSRQKAANFANSRVADHARTDLGKNTQGHPTWGKLIQKLTSCPISLTNTCDLLAFCLRFYDTFHARKEYIGDK